MNPTASSASSDDGTTVYKLANSMTVLIREDHFAPVVALQVWVGAGGADEHAEEAGVAHVHEHMLFKGTEHRGVGAIATEIESSGGHINAWTSWNETVYHIVVAARHANVGLDVLADATRHSSFDPNELEKELAVVMEEWKRGEDSPYAKGVSRAVRAGVPRAPLSPARHRHQGVHRRSDARQDPRLLPALLHAQQHDLRHRRRRRHRDDEGPRREGVRRLRNWRKNFVSRT